MKQFLIDFLKALEEAIPPPAHCHHALTYARYGSNEEGWKDKLALQINDAGVFKCFFLDDVDFSNSMPENGFDLIIQEIVTYIKSDIGAQLGIGLGQYVK